MNGPKVEQITRSDRTDRKFHVKAFAADGEGGRNGGTFRGASLNHGKRARNAVASLDDSDFKIVSLNSYRLFHLL